MPAQRMIRIEVYKKSMFERDADRGLRRVWLAGLYEENSFQGLVDLGHSFLRGDGDFSPGAAVQTLIRAYELVLSAVKENENPKPQYIIHSTTGELARWVDQWAYSLARPDGDLTLPLLHRYQEITQQLRQNDIHGYILHAEKREVLWAQHIVIVAMLSRDGRAILRETPRVRGRAWLATPHSTPPVATDRWFFEEYTPIRPIEFPLSIYPDPLSVAFPRHGPPYRRTVTAIGMGVVSLSLLQLDGRFYDLRSPPIALHILNAPYCYFPVGDQLAEFEGRAMFQPPGNPYQALFIRQGLAWMLLHHTRPIPRPIMQVSGGAEWTAQGPLLIQKLQEDCMSRFGPPPSRNGCPSPEDLWAAESFSPTVSQGPNHSPTSDGNFSSVLEDGEADAIGEPDDQADVQHYFVNGTTGNHTLAGSSTAANGHDGPTYANGYANGYTNGHPNGHQNGH